MRNMGCENAPLPFLVRVAAEWVHVTETEFQSDSALVFRDRARLTGDLSATCDGKDVQFSDIGMQCDSDSVRPEG